MSYLDTLVDLLSGFCVGVVLVAGGMTLLGYRLDRIARQAMQALRCDQDGGPM